MQCFQIIRVHTKSACVRVYVSVHWLLFPEFTHMLVTIYPKKIIGPVE